MNHRLIITTDKKALFFSDNTREVLDFNGFLGEFLELLDHIHAPIHADVRIPHGGGLVIEWNSHNGE